MDLQGQEKFEQFSWIEKEKERRKARKAQERYGRELHQKGGVGFGEGWRGERGRGSAMGGGRRRRRWAERRAERWGEKEEVEERLNSAMMGEEEGG